MPQFWFSSLQHERSPSPVDIRKPTIQNVTLTGIAIALFLSACASSTTNFASPSATTSESLNADPLEPALTAKPAASVRHEIHELDRAIVHMVWIPAVADGQLTVLTSEVLRPIDELVASVGAIAAINAGFFDPNNQQTTSFVRIDGEVVADPRQNDRLMQNSNLTSYLDAILNRSEFRHYRCMIEGEDEYSNYAITLHNAPVPTGCDLGASVGAGPQLLPRLTSVEEGFVAMNDAGQVVRDAIGSLSPNARSAIGITADKTLVLAMVAQRSDRPSPTGLTLPDLAEFLASLGVEQALNLDGGSSSSLYYEGRTYFGRLDADGKPIERAVKSIIAIQDSSTID